MFFRDEVLRAAPPDLSLHSLGSRILRGSTRRAAASTPIAEALERQLPSEVRTPGIVIFLMSVQFMLCSST
jgi:hypothetical protein